MTWYTSYRLTGGQSRFRKVTYSSYSRAFTERDKQLVNGIRTFKRGVEIIILKVSRWIISSEDYVQSSAQLFGA